jgi:hypothetical protein
MDLCSNKTNSLKRVAEFTAYLAEYADFDHISIINKLNSTVIKTIAIR